MCAKTLTDKTYVLLPEEETLAHLGWGVPAGVKKSQEKPRKRQREGSGHRAGLQLLRKREPQ